MYDLHKMLIANRGEIAVRVIRACRELGIATVAVYSDVDRNARHVQMADEAYCIGSAPPQDSYLNIPHLLDAAQRSGADSLHPGYGFLSENAVFAQACIDAGLIWVGPHPEAIRLMGDKGMAKRTVAAAGVPLVSGAREPLPGVDAALALAPETGYPVLLKATAGGGGRGMRLVQDSAEMADAWRVASNEAKAAFGDGSLYLERYLRGVRHIEFQILADKYGNVLHLGERECSVQRRHQKLIEESPSAIMTGGLRERMGAAAVAAARACGYDSVGTIEFLVDEDRNFYFLEMNTRLQVEHPVTEAVTGLDLVIEQIRSAAGYRLELRQEDVELRGHAIECRIIAEDVHHNFAPSTGKILALVEPAGPGVRVDSGLASGLTVTPYYDSMIAKVIAFASTRAAAITRLRRALQEMRVVGLETSIPFDLYALQQPGFTSGDYDLGFVEACLPGFTAAASERAEETSTGELAAIMAAVVEQQRRDGSRANGNGSANEATTDLSAWQRLVREGS